MRNSQNVIKIINIFEIATKPPNLVHPYPLIPIFIYFYSKSNNLNKLLIMLLFNFIFYSGINIWNHVNDIEEDKLAGRNHIIIRNPELKSDFMLISFILYILSFLIILSINIKAIPFFLICALVTWLYSDKTVLWKLIKRRLKDHYLTEFLTFIIAIPSYIVILWLILKTNINIKTIAAIFIIFPFALPGVILKDIKDISSDSKVGMKTLAIKFSPRSLLKSAVVILWIYYIILLIFINIGLLPNLCILSIVPIILFIYSNYIYFKYNWLININTVKGLKLMILSGVVSMISLTVLIGISQLMPMCLMR